MSDEHNSAEIEIVGAESICKSCMGHVLEGDAFCEHCGYPLLGTVELQNEFIHNRDYKVLELHEMQSKINSASTTLFVLSCFFAVSGLFYFAFNSNAQNALALLITNGVLCLIFLALGVWCKNQPVAALISGLVLYALIQVLNIIENPIAILQGILIKIIICIYLIKGLNSALSAQKIKKELNL